MCGGQPQSNPILVGCGITLCLSRLPHPRDKRACLPSFITPQSLPPVRRLCIEELSSFWAGPAPIRGAAGVAAVWLVETKLMKWPFFSQFLKENFCVFKNI
jgi:hypothetical protein